MLLDLASEWIGILDEGAAKAKLKEVEARLPDTCFAFAGATTNGQPIYFRIQGPTVVIEYAPQPVAFFRRPIAMRESVVHLITAGDTGPVHL
jgi:hypothetical protein